MHACVGKVNAEIQDTISYFEGDKESRPERLKSLEEELKRLQEELAHA